MVTTMSEPLSRHGAQLWGPESCGPDEYWTTGHCCKSCPAGQHVGEPCLSPHAPGKCAQCGPGTFTAFPNGLDSCLRCSTCRDDQEVLAECSFTRDRRCQCRTGRSYQEAGAPEVCSPCSRCPSGTRVLHACNATMNTVCSAADSGLDPRWWLYLIIVVVLVVAVVVLLRFLYKRRWRGPQCILLSLKRALPSEGSAVSRLSTSDGTEATGSLMEPAAEEPRGGPLEPAEDPTPPSCPSKPREWETLSSAAPGADQKAEGTGERPRPAPLLRSDQPDQNCETGLDGSLKSVVVV